MKTLLTAFSFALLFTVLSAVQASSIETYTFESPEQEALYKRLIKELRCLVCQNQDIADSNAELAQDLRRQTYDMVSKGASRDDIIDYMVKRYGDFVLYNPPFKLKTIMLWLGPPLFLLLSLIVLISYLRKRPKTTEVKLDNKQRESIRDLLK